MVLRDLLISSLKGSRILVTMLACIGSLGAVISLVGLDIATLERLDTVSAVHLRELAPHEQFLWRRP